MYKLNKRGIVLLFVLLFLLPTLVISDDSFFNVPLGDKIFLIEPLPEQPLVVKVSVSGLMSSKIDTKAKIETRCADGIDNDGDDSFKSKEFPTHSQMYSAAEELSKQNPDTSVKVDEENLGFFEKLIETDQVSPLGPCLVIDCWAFYLDPGELLVLTSEESYSGDISGRAILPTSNGLKNKDFVNKAVMKRGDLNFGSGDVQKNIGAKPRNNLFGKAGSEGLDVPGTDCTDSDCLGKVGPDGGTCCLEDDDCGSGVCGADNECVGSLKLGGACNQKEDCISGNCHISNKICSAGKEGSFCMGDKQCVSGTCGEDNLCNGPLSDVGEFCLLDNYCKDELTCQNYKCVSGDICEPQCEGKTCGLDGCGGDCGVCDQDDVCSNGDCYVVDSECQSSCELEVENCLGGCKKYSGCPECGDLLQPCLDQCVLIIDSDGDGVTDVEEIAAGSNPNDPDDFPGAGSEGDSDGDGIVDSLEYFECIHSDESLSTYVFHYIEVGLLITDGPFIGCFEGDFNFDGIINNGDVVRLINHYSTRDTYDIANGQLSSDIREPIGILNNNDVVGFISAYGKRD